MEYADLGIECSNHWETSQVSRWRNDCCNEDSTMTFHNGDKNVSSGTL